MRTRRRWPGWRAGLVVGVAVAGACFSERSTVTGTDESLCEGVAPAGVVRIRDFAFEPAEVRVSPGQEVTWVNCDPELHSATADDFAWDSGLLSPGTVFTRAFDAPGSFAYHCEPHPSMRGTVVVE